MEWFHVILTTYGAWLYGDPRGFRTRHHREHVKGDYKNPPPDGFYEKLESRSRSSLRQEPVVLSPEFREVVGFALIERLDALGAIIASISVGGQHAHLLVKTPKSETRAWIGTAKRHAWYVLRERGWSKKLWGKRSKAVPIRDRAHQLNVHRYILAHAEQRAWTWSLARDGQKSP